jgi:hypothetical protein
MRKFLVGLAALTAMTTGVVFAGVYFAGSKTDIAAVQAAEHRLSPSAHIEGVHVVGNYALLLVWWGSSFNNGGINTQTNSAFKRISGERWTMIFAKSGGFGPAGCTALVQHGVPASVAHQLCTGWGDVGS